MNKHLQARSNAEPAKRRDHRARPGRPPRGPVYGAIDLGTNNCRMLAVTPEGADYRVVDSFSRIVRLGEGLESTGALSERAMARTISALNVCARKLKASSCREFRAVATEACRRAANGPSFIERVRHDTGLEVETISSEQEARLTLSGCAPLLKCEKPYVLLFDIGGGSTEIVWAAVPQNGMPEPIAIHSLPLGVVTLAERHGTEPLPPPRLAKLIADIDRELAAFDAAHGVGDAIRSDRVCLLGTSGTVTTLGAIHLELPRYSRRHVDGVEMGFDAIQPIADRLAAMSCEERARHPCIGPGRADLMGMGLAVLSAICQRWPAGSVLIADRGIREGLLLEMMTRAGRQAELP